MLKNRDIIFFGLPRHDGPDNGSTSFFIAKELAKKNRVLYVDDPYTQKAFISNIKRREIKQRLKHYFPFSPGISEWANDEVSLKTLTVPPTISINSLNAGPLYTFLQGINTFIIGKRIERAIKKLGFSNIIFINSFNFYYPGLEKFISPSLYIYHCIDGMIKTYTLRHGPRLETRLMKSADAVISTSPELQRLKGLVNPNSFCIPNAADFKHSSKALSPETPVAAELESLPRPIIGYIGNIERRIDYSILEAIAKKQPSWSFVLLGPVEPRFIPNIIFSIPNIHFVKFQPFQRVPEFLKGFDVAMIPFKIDEISRTIIPLKLNEYLGAGRPVVSTCFNPDVMKQKDGVIFIADTPELFTDAISQALASNNEFNIEKRLEIARNNTWDRIGEDFSELLDTLLVKSKKN